MVFDRHILALDIAGLAQTVTERGCVRRECLRGPRVEEPDHRHRRLLRAYAERPRCRRAAKCSQKSSPSDEACHVTLRLGVMPMQCRGGYHALAKDERRSCAAKGWSGPCRSWVRPGHPAMSVQCPVCPEADTAERRAAPGSVRHDRAVHCPKRAHSASAARCSWEER